MERDTGVLSASGLAELAGVTEAEIDRMVDLGILVVRDGPGPFRTTDVQKVRLARACEEAGLPMDGIASAIRAGRLSFAFLEASTYRRWAVRSERTYRQVSEATGVPLSLLHGALESMGFAPVTKEKAGCWTRREGVCAGQAGSGYPATSVPLSTSDELIREDELEVVPLLQLGLSTGVLDEAWIFRVGRAYGEGLRPVARVESETFHARFEPVLASGLDQRQAMELASQLAGDFVSLVDRAPGRVPQTAGAGLDRAPSGAC